MSTALAEVFPVGEFLAEELDERGWTQTEFAEILGRPAQFVSEIISGKKEITRESAAQIGAALGTSPELWLNLQNAYHLWRQASDQRSQGQLEDVRLRARLKELAPISVLLGRGIIRGRTPREQKVEIEALYGITDIYDEPELLVAARRAQPDEVVSSTQLAWVACVRAKATPLIVASYSQKGLVDLAKRLTSEVPTPDDMKRLPDLFAEVGVRLVYVEAFPSSKMDGCSFLHADGKPVIGISGRGKRLDKVLFTILHEVAHIVLGHLKDHEFVIDDAGGGPTLGLEEPANERAGEWVLPKPIERLPDRMTQGWVTAEASVMNVHPIVLIGRLQNQGRLPWRTSLVKGAPSVDQQLQNWG
jgi:HTH-type transcriptional regulator/antitoxin HigA